MHQKIKNYEYQFDNVIIFYYLHAYYRKLSISSYHSAFLCSNLTKETLEQGITYVQSYQKRHQNDACVSIFYFEHVNADWDLLW